MSWRQGATGRDPTWFGFAAALLLAFLWAAPARPARDAVVRGAAAASAGPVREVGTVSGTVRLQTAAADRPAMLSPYARKRYRPPAPPAAPGPTSPETAVVYLRFTGPVPPPSGVPVRVIQRNRTILPHVSVVQSGARVEFPNEDDVFHNIFSLSGPKRFNLGRYPPGQSRSEIFAKPGVVRLFCDIHSEMNGVILVVDTPYFTRPDAEGRFHITDVPEGEYTAIVWHEVAGVDSTRVVVRPGADASVDFTLGG